MDCVRKSLLKTKERASYLISVEQVCVSAILVAFVLSACAKVAVSPVLEDDNVPSVSVRPTEIDDVLYNPGIGFADFHFGLDNPPPPDQHPPQRIAYFRWFWADLEPAEGQYNFELVDAVIRQARERGESLGFRIMTEYRRETPWWLLDKGVASVQTSSGLMPDYNDPIFLEEQEKLLRAFGQRYAGSPDIDHVDIGTVGCWGEWNTACCENAKELCGRYYPTEENQRRITDMYFKYFPNTPLIMLIGGQPEYAARRGAGWRGDCLGDYGMFRSDWNHMEHLYGPAAQSEVIGNAWKRAPVHLEVCYYMQNWHEWGYDIDTILPKALEWHASVINAKSRPVPVVWRSKVDEFLKKLGYRLVMRALQHPRQMNPGGNVTVVSQWENVGVAPMYHRWPLAYRLRSDSDQTVAQWVSPADPRQWLPGPHHEVRDTVMIPIDIPPGVYSLDVGILDHDGGSAHVALAIEGRRPDLWYAASKVLVTDGQ
jgi:hypothetical protein